MLHDIAAHISTSLSLSLAVILGVSAAHKFMERPRMTDAVAALTGLPQGLAPVGLAVAIAFECAAAVLLLLPESAALGAMLAAIIWAGYLGFIIAAIWRGRRDLDCGCSFGNRHVPLGLFDVLRNLTLISLSAFVVAAPPAGAAMMSPSALLAALGFVVLYVAADQISALKISALRIAHRHHHGN